MMGRKIFISYKFTDQKVLSLAPTSWLIPETTARDYVTRLQTLISDDHIDKAEKDDESMASFTDSTIEGKLKLRIHDSSVTIVLISKGMKEPYATERDQWIPWEISYSLKKITVLGKTSQTNAVLAVVIPDEYGSYGYYFEQDPCPHCNVEITRTDRLFSILSNNMFNIKQPTYGNCSNHTPNTIFYGEHSYIKSVKWDDFVSNHNHYLEVAIGIRDSIDSYNVCKVI